MPAGTPIEVGDSLHVENTTSLVADGSNLSTAFAILDGTFTSIYGTAAILGHAQQQNFDVGVLGQAESGASGVFGRAVGGGAGVLASSDTGNAVDAFSTSSNGVNATGAVGVNASGKTTGVYAVGTGTGSFGAQAYANNGSGLKARGTAYGVIAQSLTTDPTQAALFASAIDGMGIGCNTDTGLAFSAQSGEGGGVKVDAPDFHLRLSNGATRNAPTADTKPHERGDIVETTAGDLWLCTTAGTPGTWRKLGGPSAAGAFHLLAAPKRVYDSRPGTTPAIGSKTPLNGNVARSLDVRANSSGVPTGATGVMVTVLLVNAAQANGNLTIWAGGVARPTSNTMVWGTGSGRYTTTSVTAIDATGHLQVAASQSTDIVLDVVGYYR